MRLLLTRPQPDGERTAARLRTLGHEAILSPMLRIEALPADFGTGPFAAVVLTSANAARALSGHARRVELLDLPAFVVGRQSAEAARAVGFRSILSADGDVGGLVPLIVAQVGEASLPLLYLAGRDRAADLGAALGGYGLTVRTAIIYRAVAQPTLSAEAQSALSSARLDGALHYSRRTVEAFLSAAERAGLLANARGLVHYCLSMDVAGPLTAAGAFSIKIAARPEENALLELLRLG
jgi:uroporphyrinogen-III synthase